MSREEDEKDGALRLSLDDSKKMKPPNKKKFDEDMDGLTNQIKEKEAELEKVRQAAVEIKQLKTERMECISKRKQIVIDLEKINKEIPDRMKRLNEIEASLYYKNEDKINSAIQRLEWNLNVKTYKLTEEKKIVSEIDSLKRSKKNLVQYLTLKQEISEIRDRQKGLRDGRDRCTKDFNRLKAKEEELRSRNRSLIAIKREIDALYEQRRQTNANFKQQRGEFHELKEKHRKEGWKKKTEERKVYDEERKHLWLENDTERLPHDTDVHTCLTLTSYLNRLLPSLSDTSHDSMSPSSSQDDPEPAEEIEDGQYKLLRRSDDSDSLDHHQGGSGVTRKPSRRSRKFRKLAMDKKITHSADVITQFMSLNLTAPTCLYEVPDILEQLEKKRSFFEKEQQLCEAASDAGISATESAVCAMSRQASKTESCEGGVQDAGSSSTRPDDSVYAALFQQQQESGDGVAATSSLLKQEELCGAVGGRAEEDDWSSVIVGVGSDTPNSDSTIEGDNGSGDSLKLAMRQSDNENIRNEKGPSKEMATHSHHREKREMRRSLAISVSDSTDSSSLVEQQPTANASLTGEEFPSLLESSQSSLLSEASFPSLGGSGGTGNSNSFHHCHETDTGGGSNYKQAALSSVKGHSPLTKTFSIVPQDSSPNQHNQQQQNMPKSKSYASSVVSRTRSFSEVMPKKSCGSNTNNNSSSLNKSSSSDGQYVPTTSKQIQPPSSLSISPVSLSMNVKHKITTPTSSLSSPSSKSKPSLHRSRTLTPTLTQSWVEVRDRHRKSSGTSSGSGGGNITPSGSFNNSGGVANRSATTPTNSRNPPKSPLNAKAQVSPSLSSSAIPSPHKSSLSPRLSYPLQSKPSLTPPPPPMIVIDSDRDFPPLAQTTVGVNNSSRRNSSLSTKSSTGSLSLHDRDPMPNCSTITVTTTSDNNNNNNSCNSYLDTTQGLPSPSAHNCNLNPNVTSTSTAPSSYRSTVVAPTSSMMITTTNHSNTKMTNVLVESVSGQNQDNLFSLPKGDKSSTEKWVESSMAFVQDLASSKIPEDDQSGEEVTSL